MKIHIYDNQDHWIVSAVTQIKTTLTKEIDSHGQSSIGFSGGSTPHPVYEGVALAKEIHWSKVSLVEVDERFVPIESPEYNWTKIIDSLGADVVMRSPNVCAFDTTISTLESLDQMNRCLPPYLSVAILGMGTDGHIASLFPDGQWSSPEKTLSTNAPAEYPTQARVSLSAEYILASEKIILLIKGKEKITLIQEVVAGQRADLPVALLLKHPNVQVMCLEE